MSTIHDIPYVRYNYNSKLVLSLNTEAFQLKYTYLNQFSLLIRTHHPVLSLYGARI